MDPADSSTRSCSDSPYTTGVPFARSRRRAWFATAGKDRMMTDSQYQSPDPKDPVGSTDAIADIQARCDALAARILRRCADDGLKIAAAESLTGGLLADAFVRIPGASAVFLGSAVTYDIRAKHGILGVDATLLGREGAVHPDVARQMAAATARLYAPHGEGGMVIGLSTTGVAGPGPDGDKPAGLVYVGVAMPARRSADEAEALELHLHGTREEVRRQTVLRALEAIATRLGA